MQITKVRGLSSVLGQMKKVQKGQVAGLERGLKLAGLFLLAKSQKEVPVEFGPLKASGFVRVTGFGAGTNVQVGYTAAYAIYVHENLDAAHGEEFNKKYAEAIKNGKMKSRGKGQKAKFLEDPAKDFANRRDMRAIIAEQTGRWK